MKKKAPKEAKSKGGTLKDTLAEIRKKFGPESVMTLDQRPDVGVDSLPTGSIGLDDALGIGGYPRGRIIEIFGPESSGKTTLSLHAIAEAQKRGWDCMFIDAEQSMDPKYAKRLGVDISKLMISQPTTGEEAMQIVDSLVRGEKVGVIVIDSVAALTPKAELEGEIGEQHVGRQARLMSQSLRMLNGSIAKSNTIVIFLNQLRANLSAAATWGAPAETTTGGKALKFYASVRLDIRRIATIKKDDNPIGSRVRVKVIKNKVAAPFGQTEFDVLYNEGISREGEILALGELHEVLSKDGTSYVWGDHKLGRGYDAARAFLRENAEMAGEIEREIMAKMRVSE